MLKANIRHYYYYDSPVCPWCWQFRYFL